MANQVLPSRKRIDDDRSDIWFFDYSKEEIEELLCPPIDPEKIIGKVIGKELKGGKRAQYYLRCTDEECHVVFACLLLANTTSFKVRDRLYYVRQPTMTALAAGIISGMHFRESTWDL